MKCPKCGFMNGTGIKFCGNCGAELKATARADYVEALAVLHIATSFYVLVTLGTSYFVQNTLFFLISYAIVGVGGLYVGYEFHLGSGGKWLMLASAITIVLGAVATGLVYLIGLSIAGVFGPSWILFLFCGWLLWISRKRI
jgi:hypothetical protein